MGIPAWISSMYMKVRCNGAACNPSTGWVSEIGNYLNQAYCPAGLDKMRSSRCRERPCLKNQVESEGERPDRHTYMDICIHTYTHAYTHIHTNTCVYAHTYTHRDLKEGLVQFFLSLLRNVPQWLSGDALGLSLRSLIFGGRHLLHLGEKNDCLPQTSNHVRHSKHRMSSHSGSRDSWQRQRTQMDLEVSPWLRPKVVSSLTMGPFLEWHGEEALLCAETQATRRVFIVTLLVIMKMKY